jgi:hypothetical protein
MKKEIFKLGAHEPASVNFEMKSAGKMKYHGHPVKGNIIRCHEEDVEKDFARGGYISQYVDNYNKNYDVQVSVKVASPKLMRRTTVVNKV